MSSWSEYKKKIAQMRPLPMVVNNIFDEKNHQRLQKYAMNLWSNAKESDYNSGFGRYQWVNTPILKETADLLLPKAKEIFKSDTLKHSWVTLVIYETNQAKLWKHKDDNACTYTIDYCLFQKKSWDLWVIDRPYTLHENDALFMYGNDQEHWREPFPDPKTNLAAYIFYFYCEPDHWYFTEGPSYLDRVIRAKPSS